MRITPQMNQRSPCKTNWWTSKSQRFYLPGAEQLTDLTYPKGYDKENTHWDEEMLIYLHQ